MTGTIDHILHFASPEAVDLAALGVVASEGEPPVTLADLQNRAEAGVFEGSAIAARRVYVIAADAVHDADGKEVEPRVEAPGVWLAVRSTAFLANLPGLVAASDAECRKAGQPFVLYINPDYPLESLRKRITPMWMGTDYDLSGLSSTDIVEA